MAAFAYKALDAKGRNKKGIIEADTAKAARGLLRDKGLIPVEVQTAAQQEKNTASQKQPLFSFERKISAADLALITRQLSTLSASGLPIEESLLAVAQQCDVPRIERMIMAVRSKVTEGYTLADSMAEYPHIFDNLFCSMVAAGEKSGHLDTVLERLADYTEQRQVTKSKIQQASVYPVMLMVVAFSVVYFLLTSVVPKIVAQFDRLGGELPGTTQFMIAMSNFLSAYGPFLILLVLGSAVVFQRLMKKEKPRYQYHKLLLKMPLAGKVSRGLNTARFARTLSILTASAVPLLESMKIAGDVLSNDYIKEAIQEARLRVREGTSLRAALDQTKLFPPMMLHMIASGEKSGELESMLSRAADNQDREFEGMVNVTLSIIGPAMVLSMAAVVFFIVISILQPIMALNSMVG
ncbi:type II secretion system inner membrane protein GspF [Catenovulum sp. 2E275]|uniref:type II secretion system inner membrane protein GspF n=1 Tax=Catenovulum sp. 2E275 TaxID=2980497 RepID=UPI0021D2F809|nr:type II secretion system inner membrane protein GspF [Catenovulum sp. 2E275]MCU4674392.1 type II secretion system inner membrane protein GspF [Catenovulum sp. 2E275]